MTGPKTGQVGPLALAMTMIKQRTPMRVTVEKSKDWGPICELPLYPGYVYDSYREAEPLVELPVRDIARSRQECADVLGDHDWKHARFSHPLCLYCKHRDDRLNPVLTVPTEPELPEGAQFTRETVREMFDWNRLRYEGNAAPTLGLSVEDQESLKTYCAAQDLVMQYLEDSRHTVLYRALRIMLRQGRFPADTFDPMTEGDLSQHYLNRAQLDDMPLSEPLIEGVLNRETTVILRGRDGTFKSFVALDWALSLATRRHWQCHDVPERVKVLYIAAEGAQGIGARVTAWEKAWEIMVDPEFFTVRTSAVNMFEGGADFDDLLERAGEYGLVVLDTMRRHSGGADANGSDMGVVIDNIERLKRATDEGCVLVIAHTDKGDNDTRGFSGQEDDADTVWAAKRDGMRLDLELTKMKDGPDGYKVALQLRETYGSLIIEAGSEVLPEIESSRNEQIFMQAMQGMFAATGATKIEIIEATGIARSSFYRAQQNLVSKGLLILAGTKSRRRWELP